MTLWMIANKVHEQMSFVYVFDKEDLLSSIHKHVKFKRENSQTPLLPQPNKSLHAHTHQLPRNLKVDWLGSQKSSKTSGFQKK